MPATAATTTDTYIEALPDDRKEAMEKLRAVIRQHIPEGFEEQMSYGMIGWVVPHSLYPAGYHCKPETPLPFFSIASQKNYIAIYDMGLYADPVLYDWFMEAYAERVKGKLDMGKSCIRFKKPETIPYELIGELAAKLTVAEWITLYERNLKR